MTDGVYLYVECAIGNGLLIPTWLFFSRLIHSCERRSS